MKTIELIKKRSQFFTTIRQFFSARDVWEVDTALLTPYGVTDVQLNSLRADDGYLITSPEFAMKMLLCDGAPSIYQLSHVFRGEELGRKHRKEFMLLEWYRLGWTHQQLMDEVAALIQMLLPERKLPVLCHSYAGLFKDHLDIDIFQAKEQDISSLCAQKLPESAAWQLTRDGYLDLLFTHYIEPHLGKNSLEFVTNYPPSQAALARITKDDNNHDVAARFEAYIDGIELCNGFYELGDSAEQRMRFEEDNKERLQENLPPMPIDEDFLQALEKGLPSCAGVALGVDRLFMLACSATHIEQVVLQRRN